MRLNVSASMQYGLRTHEGAPAKHISPEQQLRRSVMAHFLFEKNFYEDGVAIAERIVAEARAVPLSVLAEIAFEARQVHGLRHVPLLLASVLAQRASETP